MEERRLKEANEDLKKYDTCMVEQEEQVVTITLLPRSELPRVKEIDVHSDVANILNELRIDNSVRVIVLTGSFVTIAQRSHYSSLDDSWRWHLTDPAGSWNTFSGVIRAHQAMTEIEKPVVTKVKGNAMGFGSNLVFASDIIVAEEDSKINDMHLAMGEVDDIGPEFGIVPGDGGCALVPLYMTPAKAKEYLMLAKTYTGKELAELGIINYAVPKDKLDETVDDIVKRLLKRSSYALAWAKRVANRRVADQLNMTLDAAAAYEMVNFLQAEKMGWKDKKTLD